MPTNNESFVRSLVLRQNETAPHERVSALYPYAWIQLSDGKLPVGPGLIENLAELLECVDDVEPKTYRVKETRPQDPQEWQV